MKDKYGSSEKIFRDDISSVHDCDEQALRRKFGTIKIYLLNSDTMIKKSFFSANDSSISVISHTYKSTTGKTLYAIKDIAISDIEKIHWRYGKAGAGIALGGLTGAITGGIIGANASYDEPKTFAAVFEESADAMAGGLVGIVVGFAAGAVVGGLIQYGATRKSAKISIKGYQILWEQSKSQLPPFSSITQ